MPNDADKIITLYNDLVEVMHKHNMPGTIAIMVLKMLIEDIEKIKSRMIG